MFYYGEPLNRPEPVEHKKVKKRALARAFKWWDENPVFLDTETTGLDDKAEVVELAIVDSDGSVLIDTLVNPVRPISRETTEIHGISEEDVATAPTWPEIHNEVREILSGRPIVVYNYNFDIRIISQTISYHWFVTDWFDWPKARCAMKLFARYQGSWNDYFGNYSWHKLTSAAKQLGIKLDNAHRALTDAMATRKLLKKMSLIYQNPDLKPEFEVNEQEGWLV